MGRQTRRVLARNPMSPDPRYEQIDIRSLELLFDFLVHRAIVLWELPETRPSSGALEFLMDECEFELKRRRCV